MTNIEKIISNKIDWKFFNYLKDKATEFEDAGHIFRINVYVCDGNVYGNRVYIYNTEKSEGFIKRYFLRTSLDINNLTTCIFRVSFDDEGGDILDRYLNVIKNKIEITHIDNGLYFAEVEPKKN